MFAKSPASLSYMQKSPGDTKIHSYAALFLDLGILPIQYEIEKKQLLYLKCVLEKNADDPVQQTYYQTLEYQGENNWANHITFLRRKYNLPLNDCNLLTMSKQQWKTFVTGRIKHHAFKHLTSQRETNWKTMHLKYSKLGQSTYLTALKAKYASVIFKARTRIYDIKRNFTEKYEGNTLCPFCRRDAKSFEYIFKCQDGLICPLNRHDITLASVVDFTDTRFLKRVGKYLIKYEKFREVVI